MKKQRSVFALHARAALGRLALVLLGMLALDAAAYALFGLRMYPPSLTGSALVTALRSITFQEIQQGLVDFRTIVKHATMTLPIV